MTATDTAEFTRTAATLVAANDARECATSMRRLAELLEAEVSVGDEMMAG